MVSRNFEMAMQAIRSGNMDEGGRMMRIVLKEEMPPNIRAVALMWLAETSPDIAFKLDCYRQAQGFDPNNADVNARLSALLASQLPPANPTPAVNPPPMSAPPPATAPTQPSAPNYPGYPQYGNVAPNTPQAIPSAHPQPMPMTDAFVQSAPAVRANDPFSGQPPLDIPTLQRTVGISGGPNGIGTGFFVSNRGIIATTRYIVGSNTQVDVILNSGQALKGIVLRSFPSFDLAFVRVNAVVRQLPPFSSMPVIMDDTPLIVVNYKGEGLRTTKRATKQESSPQWFPTLLTELTDAGGDAVFDGRGVLLGAMTKNALRTNNYLYGLHLTAIVQCLDVYTHETQTLSGAETYCPSCGSVSRASAIGGFYCETCGSTLPQFTQAQRFPQANQNISMLYNELNPPCRKCTARVGYSNNLCLRCGESTQ